MTEKAVDVLSDGSAEAAALLTAIRLLDAGFILYVRPKRGIRARNGLSAHEIRGHTLCFAVHIAPRTTPHVPRFPCSGVTLATNHHPYHAITRQKVKNNRVTLLQSPRLPHYPIVLPSCNGQ